MPKYARRGRRSKHNQQFKTFPVKLRQIICEIYWINKYIFPLKIWNQGLQNIVSGSDILDFLWFNYCHLSISYETITPFHNQNFAMPAVNSDCQHKKKVVEDQCQVWWILCCYFNSQWFPAELLANYFFCKYMKNLRLQRNITWGNVCKSPFGRDNVTFIFYFALFPKILTFHPFSLMFTSSQLHTLD